MQWMKRVFTVALMFSLSACTLDVLTPNGEIKANLTVDGGNIQGSLLTCSANLPASFGGVTASGVATPVEIRASGGVGPYQVLDTAVAFASETVISRTYTNTGSMNLLEVDTVTVKDSLGLLSQCNFLVTVTPDPAPSDLACTIAATPTNPQIGAPVSMLVTASGGKPSYTFSNLDLGANSTVISALSPISATQASASGSFSTAGLRSVSAKVMDAAGDFVVCSTSVNVAQVALAPSVAVAATPATSVQVGSGITLVATPSNFTGNVTYQFSTSTSGVFISPSFNTALVTVTDGQAKSNVIVNVVATSGSQQASSQITLTFTAAPPNLTCSLSYPSGTYYVNNQVNFTMTATSGEALEITSFNAAGGSVVSQTQNSRGVTFSTSGTKVVSAVARSVSTGTYCNSGASISQSVTINAMQSPLVCSAYTYYNPTHPYTSFYAYAVVSGGGGTSRWVNSMRVLQNGTVFSNYGGYWYDAYTAVLSIYQVGTFTVELTAKDNLGNTAVCSTTHIVN